MTPHRTRIKICGLTREADVDAAARAGTDAVGFVLYDKSLRHVTPERAGELARRLPAFITPVLLFVNASPAYIQRACEAVPNALLQFHGDESPADCLAAGVGLLVGLHGVISSRLPKPGSGAIRAGVKGVRRLLERQRRKRS